MSIHPFATGKVPFAAACFVGVMASIATAEVQMQWAVIGNEGNAADTTGFGRVDYRYSIARHEVTNAQYAEFLNAKARNDVHGLYNESMGTSNNIVRTGAPGSYSYSVASGRGDHPVAWVSFMDSMRFVNWLQNGQGDADTETGTYAVGGGLSESRASGERFVIAGEDEWYKAAFHRPGMGYAVYGCSTDAISASVANYADFWEGTTAVGQFAANAYGVFDMAGNLSEWNEAIIGGSARGIRGGSWSASEGYMHSGTRAVFVDEPIKENGDIGFRVAFVPGPGVGAITVVSAVLVRRRRAG